MFFSDWWENTVYGIFNNDPFLLFTFLAVAWVFIALLLAVILLVCIAVRLRKNALRKKQKREEMKERERRLQFTLPDKNNVYLRMRLNTVLRSGVNVEETEHLNGVCFLHAQTLLAKIKEAPLSPAERLETEELSALFQMYKDKEKLTAAEVQTVNQTFSRILKLSAKYAV